MQIPFLSHIRMKIVMNNDEFIFKIFDNLEDGIVILTNKTSIFKVNSRAKEWGIIENKDLLNCISFNKIDQLTESILSEKDYQTEDIIYFIKGFSKFCKIIYNKEYKILLLQDKTQIELLKKVKEDFVSSISHELRTPLTIAKGNVQILDDFMENKKFSPQIYKIQESLVKIEDIISKLTLLSLAEFGDYILKKEIVNIKDVYLEVIKDLEETINDKSVELVFDCELEKKEGDRFVLYIILKNLLSNAIKYSYNNSKIYIKINSQKIEVTDEGIGIRQEELPRIFERFYRSPEATKYAKGSGLGLSVVKHLCHLSNYKIECESKWMIGTTFKILFNDD